MTDDFIEFWRCFQAEPGLLNVHPDDRVWMERHWPTALAEPCRDWKSYRHSERFGSRDTHMHLSLLPVPFWGDLRRANVIVCLANAGFDNTLYYLESHPEFREHHLRVLRQKCEGMDFPLIHLDPRFGWSGPFQWWETRLRPILTELQLDGHSYLEALRILSQQVAVVQVFPYHSLDGSKLKGKSGPRRMPSVLAAQRYLAGVTQRGEQLVVLMRSHADWLTDACAAPGKNFVHGPRLQGVSFHPRFAAGAAMLERIRNGLR